VRELPKAWIEEKVDVNPDLFKLWVRPEVRFVFEPGQYITIGKDGTERPYSIVSAPHEDTIELFIERISPDAGGRLTPILSRLKVGDYVSMRPVAKGRFLFQPHFKNHVMVATVTGIAPFVSMVRHAVHEEIRDHRLFVLQGASHRDEFGYREELERFAQTHSNRITYVATVSRPDAERNRDWRGPTGRVNLLVEDYIDRWGLTQANTGVYLCGHPGMIEDVTDRLGSKHWRVMSERYWKG
jgi:NAD(P)H-flavin reductase